MDNATALDHAVGAHHLGHRLYGGDLRNGNTGFFEFRRNRSTAACGRPSRRGENDRLYPIRLQLRRDFATESATVS